MTFATLLEQLLNGITVGAAYALIGGGLALIYGTMRLFNFAHGEFYMVGGYAFYFLAGATGLPAFPAIVLATALAFAAAALIERFAVRPLMAQEGWTFSTIAATLGLSIVLQQLAQKAFGERPKSVPYLVEGALALGPIALPYQRVLILVVSVLVMAATGATLRYTRLGRAIRAVAQDPEAAAVLGIPTPAVQTLVFATGSGLAAIAATLLAPIYGITPWMGAPLMIKAFVVVVLGGLGSFSGAILGGFALGIVEAVGITLTASEWRDVIAFGAMLLVVWFRPEGLFGERA